MIKGKHIAWYGDVKTIKMYCEDCDTECFVIDDIKQCCNKTTETELVEYQEQLVEKLIKRKGPTNKQKEEIIAEQGDQCIYCGVQFGVPYYRKARPESIHLTRRNWDHLVPYIYALNNMEFVLACNLCNTIKSSRIFDTVEEVIEYVKIRRKEKGIIIKDEMSEMWEAL